jgi:hypothetical protein
MRVMVTVTVHEGEGDLKNAEFVGRFRGAPEVIARDAAEFASRSVMRAKPEPPQRLVRLTEEEEVQ